MKPTPLTTPSGQAYLHLWMEREPRRICMKLAASPRFTIKLAPEIIPEMARIMLDLIKESPLESAGA
ncbi:MAG: hypothetical protein EBT03_12535 [Betaproteobacteria bacterium]|nr:hypothetical protein [Betaproteobacteria bacterium]